MNSWYIAMNLVRRIIGTKKGFLVSIILPTVIISAIVSLAAGSKGGEIAIMYVDHDNSAFSEHLINELDRRPGYSLERIETDQDARDAIVDEDASSAFIIPKGYEESLLKGEAPVVTQVRLAMNETTVTLEMAINEITRSIADAVLVANAADRTADDKAEIYSLLEQQRKHQISGETVEWRENAGAFLSSIIGFMLMFLMIVMNQSLTAIVEDRRNQTMARIYASPVYGAHIAVGNFLGSVFLGTIQLTLIMLITRFIFQYDSGVAFWHEFVIMECFILAALGISSAVGGLVRNSDQLGVINNLIMTPTCMLGGCFWPISFMPEFMQKIANFVPQKWAIEAMTRLSQGEVLTDVWLPIAILILFAVVLLGFGAAVLRPSEASR